MALTQESRVLGSRDINSGIVEQIKGHVECTREISDLFGCYLRIHRCAKFLNENVSIIENAIMQGEKRNEGRFRGSDRCDDCSQTDDRLDQPMNSPFEA